MSEFKPIVSMVVFNGQIMVATSDGIYRMNDGKPELVAGPEHFRLADELWDAGEAVRERLKTKR
jgi:hypothetical protein